MYSKRNNKAVAQGTSPTPTKIRVRREARYHTHNIGRLKDGTQFMEFLVAVPPKGKNQTVRQKLRWYAVLHRFDSDGVHLGTESTFLGAKEFVKDIGNTDTKLRELIGRLGRVTYQDVEIRPFAVSIDGVVFGLVDSSIPEKGYQRIDLVPNGLSFFPPWDGTYST